MTQQGLPLMVDISEFDALVVGGGRVGLAKTQTLLSGGALVTVISEDFDHRFVELQQREGSRLALMQRRFAQEDLLGRDIVVVAISDKSYAKTITRLARGCTPLVCNASSKEFGTVAFMASFREQEMTFAVSSGGTSPRKAKLWRQLWQDTVTETTTFSANDVRPANLQE